MNELPNSFTPQELFSFVKGKLLKQNKKSLRENGDCAYRGQDRCKCAAGHVILDEEYLPEMEGRRIESIILADINTPFSLRLMEHLDLLRDLQIVHDKYEVKDWPSGLIGAAQKHGLQNI